MGFKPDQQMTTYAEMGLAPDHGQINAVESLIGLDVGLSTVVVAPPSSAGTAPADSTPSLRPGRRPSSWRPGNLRLMRRSIILPDR
jgi:hypothetical protein